MTNRESCGAYSLLDMVASLSASCQVLVDELSDIVSL